jgi:hypothetical protein
MDDEVVAELFGQKDCHRVAVFPAHEIVG